MFRTRPVIILERTEVFKGQKDHLVLYGFSTPRPLFWRSFFCKKGVGKLNDWEKIVGEYDAPRQNGEVSCLLRKGNKFYFDFSKEIIRSLEQKNSIDLTLSATIVVVNDTNETINYKTAATFVNGKPVIAGKLSLAPMQKAAIRASDVSVAQAKNGKPAYFMEIIKE